MKRALFIGLGAYLAYVWVLDFTGDWLYWLPQWMAVCDGQVIGQTLLLGVLALFAFGIVVHTSYEFLSWIFD